MPVIYMGLGSCWLFGEKKPLFRTLFLIIKLCASFHKTPTYK
jgi:hypothetical protein